MIFWRISAVFAITALRTIEEQTRFLREFHAKDTQGQGQRSKVDQE